MGIDLLEIRFRLESRFGFKLAGGECFAFHNTAGTLLDLVWQKVNGLEPGIPDIHEIYERVHAAASETRTRWRLSRPRNARLTEMFDKGDLDLHWRRFQQALDLPLPPLIRSGEWNELTVPPECSTVSRLVQWIIDNHPHCVRWLRPPGGITTRSAAGPSHEECWSAIREILADTLALDPEQVTLDAHLVDDLGLE